MWEVGVGREGPGQRGLGLAEVSSPGQLRLLALALECAADGVLIIDEEQRPVFVNETGQRLLRCDLPCQALYPLRDLGSPSIRALLSPLLSPLRQALRGQTVPACSIRFAQPDGSRIPLQLTASPIKDEGGRIIGALATFREAQPRSEKRHERLAVESEVGEGWPVPAPEEGDQAAKAFLNAVSESLCLVDADATLLSLNSTQARVLKKPVHKLLGTDLFSHFPSPVAEHRRAQLQRVVRSGKPLRFQDEHEGRHIEHSLFPLLTPDGQVEKVAIFSMDVTQRAHAVEDLEAVTAEKAATVARLQAIVDNLPEGVLVLDSGGQISLANGAAQRMLPEAQVGSCLISLASSSLRRPDGSHYAFPDFPLARALRGERVEGEEAAVFGPEGRRWDVLISAVPLPGPRAGVSEVVAVLADITQLKQLDRHKDLFISYASHELRTPLTPMKGYSEILRRRLAGQPDRQPEAIMVDTIRRNIARLERLADALIDVTQARLGRLAITPRRVDLVSLLQQVVAESQETTSRHHLRLHCQEPSLIGDWDGERVAQVVHHLVTNAINYSPEGGPIEITLTRQSKWVEIAVRDEGIGIPEEAQASIFGAFVKAHGAEVACSKGLGLGLYLCQQIINLHGGHITVSSRPGEGSTFTVTLPLSSPNGSEA